MSNLFRRQRREVNKITDADLGEVSAVQGPAQPKARWLVKSLDGTTTQLGFMPLHIEKAGEADPSWPDEDVIDDATDPDMDFVGRVARKRAKKAMKKTIKKMIRKAVDTSDGQSGRSFSESDRPGSSQDTRDPTEHADDTIAIIRTMDSNPPIAAENWRTYADRVFGDAIDEFTSDELNAATNAFAEMRRNVQLQKSLGDGINELAYRMRLESGNTLSFAKCFTEVCKQHPDLYATSRGIVKTDDNRAVRKDYTRADSTMNVAGDDADGMSPEEANAFILRCASELQQQYRNWSRTMCLVTAGSQHPGIYHRSKG